MMFRILIIALLFIHCNSYSQSRTLFRKVIDGDTVWVEEPDVAIVNRDSTEIIFIYVEKMPQASYDAQAYLAKNFRIPYESNALKHPIRTNVRFMVRRDGSIDSVKVLTKASAEWTLETTRVVRSMPPWKPGTQNGRPVNVWYTLPIILKTEQEPTD